MKYQATAVFTLLALITVNCFIENFDRYRENSYNGYKWRRRLFRSRRELSKAEKVRRFLCGEYERRATEICNKNVKAEWAFVTDLDDKKKEEASLNATLEKAHFDKQVYLLYLKDLDVGDIEDEDLLRQLKMMANIEYAALSDDNLERLMRILEEMQKIYSTAKICPFAKPKCDLKKEGISFTPDIEAIMANSSDYDELLYTWVSWHDATGETAKKQYEMYVILANEAARANNFSDLGAMRRNEFESPNLEEDVEALWNQVEPLYEELHTFVRLKLRKLYEKEFGVEDDGLISAHLLGNMWAQDWSNIKGLVTPFPEEPNINIEEVFQEKNMTPLKMFHLANDFYVSLGMESMKDAFDVTKGAVIEKKGGKSMVCHASAWDFCDGQDFRVKMCTQVDYQDFIAIHHELGHIQYFMQYSRLPYLFRNGANPAFHEAIGDTIGLSVMSPGHFIKIGLVNNMNITFKQEINQLMEMALEKIAFLPFGLLLEKWRWDILAERIDPDSWNEHFWDLREEYQRVKPPMVRGSEEFDPGSKFHILADSQYISYFLAHILQFQLHKGLCLHAGEYIHHDPRSYLHRCDIYKSRLAGSHLKHALRLGSAQHWSYVLKEITGEMELSSEGLVQYFTPLYQFLKQANERSTQSAT